MTISPNTVAESAAHPRDTPSSGAEAGRAGGASPPGVIVCRGVEKRYATGGREVHALRGLDLTIAEPGFYAIMGQSGSGKTTLLHLLAALDRPDAGEIVVAGERVDQLKEKQATLYRRLRVGVVFQQFNLLPTLTALENVELPASLARQSGPQIRERAEMLLVELGLADRMRHRPQAMSGGEQQRVAIARALLFEPPVILADEPTGALDSASSEKLWSLLAQIAGEKKTTVLMVTHEPAAAAHCRAVSIMRDGRLAGGFISEGLDAAGVAARYQECVGSAR